MQLRPDQLPAQLEKPLAPLYILHGDEPLLILEAADAIRSAARIQGYDEREVLVAGAGFRWDQLAQAGGNLSLFGGNLLIDLRIPSGKPGRDGGEALQRHCQRLGNGVLTLVTLPQVDWQTKKAAWFTTLNNAGVALELNAPPLRQLPDWVAMRLARQKQSAPPDALEFIAAHVEGNLLAAHQEIQKLALLYPAGQLTLAQVQEAVLDVARYDVDKLRAALLAGDAPRCARLLEGLRAEDTAPPLVLWALAQEARTLAQLRAQLDQGASFDAACSTAKIFGPRQGPYRNAAQRCPMPLLRAALLQAARIDRMIKGLTRGDLWDEFLQLALRLTQTRKAAA
ncbi:MAG: DNA polymerase III subunit delta [Sterolibacterium sp.]|nr:DNA polymerase III subunit delta [Sterolibacterium sp.]